MSNFLFQRRRPIHLACENGHLEIVKLLLQNNCNIECGNTSVYSDLRFEINNCSFQEKRPIHLACMNGHLDIAKLLLQKNFNIECEDNEVITYRKLNKKLFISEKTTNSFGMYEWSCGSV